jgi:hypothetical protein
VHADIKAGPTAVDQSWRLLFERRLGGGCHAARSTRCEQPKRGS